MRRVAVGAAVLGGLVLAAASPSTQSRAGSPLRIEQVDGRDAVAAEVLVKLHGPASSGDLADISRVADSETATPLGRTGLRRLRSRSRDARTLTRLLTNHPAVAYAEPNYIVGAFTDPTDPLTPQLWGLRNVGQAVNGGLAGRPGADIHAAQAWDVSLGSTAHVVAVIDTGIDYTHPDLAGNVWSAPASFAVTIGGVSIVCPAGSHGFNVIALSCDPMDDNHHGTHIAGTIGAAGDGVGVVGVNWIAQLMGVKFLNSAGSGSVADAINALDFVMQARQAFSATGGADVRVLSNSWGGRSFSQALRDEIAATSDADMLFVAAAGNDGFSNDILPNYPASYDVESIVAVAATTNTDGRAYFSNYGATSVDLGAPGVDILSTTIGNTYSFSSGTSMATPHVSGAAALVLSRCILDTQALKSTLLSTVEPTAALASLTVTGGRLDVNSAIRACIAPPAAPTGLIALGKDGSVALSWSGVPGATAFVVKRSDVSGGPYAVVAPGISATTFVDTTVVNDRTYYYVVSATNGLGESGVSNEASARPKARADLVVSVLTIPANAGASTVISASVTTRNQGTGTAAASTTRFFLSRNPLIDATDVLLAGAQTVALLPPAAVNASVVSLDIPAGTGVGLYYVIAKADADNVEAETVESNNTLLRLLSVGPDLIATSLAAPATAGPGGAIAVSETVKNQGGGSSAASTTRFYLSANAALDAADVLLTGARFVPGLASGATSTGTTTVTIPPGTGTGMYYLFAKADADTAVLETYETNNTTLRLIQVGGDLVVTTLTVPLKVGAGSSIAVSDTTTNQGAGAIATSTTRFYLSANLQIDASDRLLAGARVVPALGASTGSAGTTTVAIPVDVATGSYFLIAKADADGVVVETQEANNVTARSVAVGPDLTVSALTVPYTNAAGATVSVSETVLNLGAGAAGTSTTRFYLSTNISLDAGDVVLGGGRSVPALVAGATSAGATLVTIPAGTAPGTYYFFAKTDGDSVVAESQEGNNISLRAIQVTAGQ
jgi:subtilisin family serine protease/subtilase family serine protease